MRCEAGKEPTISVINFFQRYVSAHALERKYVETMRT